MSEYLKVEGHEHLVRDMGSKAIVSTNKYAYIAAVERSRNAQKAKDELRDATREINTLKSEMHEIKSLLLQLVEKDGR
tara:strand:+ start:684 stop:917 length:234 start_codon:yes stop_codon:yes gene_type:complete